MESDLLIKLLQCNSCNNSTLQYKNQLYMCAECGSHWKFEDNILVGKNSNVNQADEENSLYITNTKQKYQGVNYSSRYLDRYKRMRLKNIYHMFIAKREKAVIDKLLQEIKDDLKIVIDLPAGTGKLASIHSKYNYKVLAADVSPAMLKTGENEWQGTDLIGFVQSDITKTGFKNDAFDCFISLRLMHRLPRNIMDSALQEIKRVTKKYLLVSNGVNSESLAFLLNKKRSSRGEARMSKEEWNQIISSYGHIVKDYKVSPLISKEVISLVQLKD